MRNKNYRLILMLGTSSVKPLTGFNFNVPNNDQPQIVYISIMQRNKSSMIFPRIYGRSDTQTRTANGLRCAFVYPSISN